MIQSPTGKPTSAPKHPHRGRSIPLDANGRAVGAAPPMVGGVGAGVLGLGASSAPPPRHRAPRMSRGARMLGAWMRANRGSQAAVARAIGLHRVALFNYSAARRTPTLAIAAALEDATGVPMRAWLDVDK